jgi:hypothetical protein
MTFLLPIPSVCVARKRALPKNHRLSLQATQRHPCSRSGEDKCAAFVPLFQHAYREETPPAGFRGVAYLFVMRRPASFANGLRTAEASRPAVANHRLDAAI